MTCSRVQALHRFAGGGEERPHLLLEGFDAEQVWLQLDGQLKGAAQKGRKLLRKAGDVPHLLQPGMEDALQGEPMATHPFCPTLRLAAAVVQAPLFSTCLCPVDVQYHRNVHWLHSVIWIGSPEALVQVGHPLISSFVFFLLLLALFCLQDTRSCGICTPEATSQK